MKTLAIIGIILIFGSQIFGFAETWYFGFNWLPKSPAEKICDIITLIADTMGWLLFTCVIIRVMWTSVF